MRNLYRNIYWKIRRATRSQGVDFGIYNSQNPDYQIMKLIERRSIDTVLDIGANKGQFADYIRLIGFKGNIHSFEPLPDAYTQLVISGHSDSRRYAYNFALSDMTGMATIHVGRNDQTSSLMETINEPMSNLLISNDSAIEIPVKRLDQLIESGDIGSIDLKRTLIKIDVQGSEMKVLRGMGAYLASASSFLCETSLFPLYDGESDLAEISTYLAKACFSPLAFKGGLHHPVCGALLQIDVLFENFGDVPEIASRLTRSR